MTSIALLLVIFVMGVLSHNYAVSMAMVILLLIRITPLEQYFPVVQKYGLTVGIVVLMVGVMAPLASGKIETSDLLRSFTHWRSLLAIAVGVLVAWLGGRGTQIMLQQPQLVTGLLIGTVLGVAFFKGVPVGPLIAAGILAVVLWEI